MTGIKFKYSLDKTGRIVTWSVVWGTVLAGVLLWWLSPGRYLPVWFVSIAMALIALALLSVPRSIRITDDAVEISCLLEITHIPHNHIRSVRRIERAELKPFVPVFASPGFFGYFGYWLDVKGWDFIKVYASTWRNLVIIEDIYEQRYLVSCDDPEALRLAIEGARKPKRAPRKKKTKPEPEISEEPVKKEQMTLF